MRWSAAILMPIILVVLLIVGFGKQAAAATPTPARTVTATPTRTDIPLIVDLTVAGTYFHPSGVFSIPLLTGWDLSPDFEDQIAPTLFNSYTQVETTFINRAAQSVLSVYVEKLSSVRLTSVKDANSYFTARYFATAWANYSGGFSETARRVDRERLIIDFKVRDQGAGFVARQVSRLEKGWLITVRLIVPDNDPALLNRLDQKLAAGSGLTFYPDVAAVPVVWAMLRDTTTTAPAYFVKYPAPWIVNPVLNAVGGVISGTTVVLNVAAEPDKAVRTPQNARAWVTAMQPDATTGTVKPETRGAVSGFSVSYQYVAPDGKPQSALGVLLNGPNNTLYALVIKTSLVNIDLLSDAADSRLPDLARIRGTFTVLPSGAYLSLPRPKLQVANIPTATLAPNPLAFDFRTAQIYRSPDSVLEMKLPIGWKPISSVAFEYYSFEVEPTSRTYITIQIGSLFELYNDFYTEDYISREIDAGDITAETLLTALQEAYVDPDLPQYTEIYPVQMGTLRGFAFAFKPKAGTSTRFAVYERRIADLPGGQVVYVSAGTYSEYMEKAGPVITAMLDSLVINSARIPTPTVTPTPYPLLLTATALQQQFRALTGTPRPQKSPTAKFTQTAIPSSTATPGRTVTAGATATDTAAATNTDTNTATVPPASTPTATHTNTIAPSATATPDSTDTVTPTRTIGPTATPSVTQS